MAEKTVKTRIQMKHDTSTNWSKAVAFIPLEGEIIFYSDVNKIKIGDGKTLVNDLPFIKVTKEDITDFNHSHDDIYYTETEIDSLIAALSNLLDTKLDSFSSLSAEKISGNFNTGLTPSATNTFNIGSETNRWKDLYLDGSLIYEDKVNISADGVLLKNGATLTDGTNTLTVEEIAKHNHDDRYYTEAEIDSKIANFTHTITANAEDDDVVVLTGTQGANAVTYKATHANSGVEAGTYRSVTVDSKGHITTGTNPTTLAEFGIVDAYTQAQIDSELAKKLPNETKYAGSSSVGGSATSAVKLDTTTAGSVTQPVYFTGGKPVATTYSLAKSVPADAKFTDTTYESATSSKAGLMSATDKSNLDMIVNSFTSDDANTTVDTIKEVLKAFENAPEGTNIVNALAGKADNVEATQEVAGLMSAEDKKFLEDIVIPSYGDGCTASGEYSHAEGHETLAEGDISHAEGEKTTASDACSHAEGYKTVAYGACSHAEGWETTARGRVSHAEGVNTIAFGEASHAEGSNLAADGSDLGVITTIITDEEGNETEITVAGSKAHGKSSHAEGVQTLAYGHGSHAEGNRTRAVGTGSHTEGDFTTAYGEHSHAEGALTTASGIISHAEGCETTTSGQGAHAEGYLTTAEGEYSHAEGYSTTASGDSSHAEGESTRAEGESSHAEGQVTTASGDYSHAEGYSTTASGVWSHAEGEQCTASEEASHAEGAGTTASGACSHAEGNTTTASGWYSHAEGYDTSASGEGSHAEGYGTDASGAHSHAEGEDTTASGEYSHAEGSGTTAEGDRSHAEGRETTASAHASHAEGISTIASNDASHAEGVGAKASGFGSHAGGYWTVAGCDYQTVIGQYNDNKVDTLFEIGNGTGESNRSNALEVLADGRVKVYGEPTEDEDVVRKVDLVSKIANLTASDIPSLATSKITSGTFADERIASAATWNAKYNKPAAGIPASDLVDLASSKITSMTGYSKSSTVSAITTSDSLNKAIGKLEAALDKKLAKTEYITAGASKPSSQVGTSATAEGTSVTALGEASHAEGYNTDAFGAYSHAEGNMSTTTGNNSHAEGRYTYAVGESSHAEGAYVAAFGTCSHAEGYGEFQASNITFSCTANSKELIIASSSADKMRYVKVGGTVFYNTSNGNVAPVTSKITAISAVQSDGTYKITISKALSTVDVTNKTCKVYSYGASGDYSHAEGNYTIASGSAAHVEGYYSTASGSYSHAEGDHTTASSAGSHAEGYYTVASGFASHASGRNTVAGSASQFVIGQYNNNSSSNVFEIGWGTSSAPKNILAVSTSGSVTATAFNNTSDRRLKENIKEYTPQKSILDLPIVEFDLKDTDVHQIGCIAQDLQEICPEIVTADDNGYLSITESKLTYLLLLELKRLNSEVNELKQKLNENK